MNKKEIKIKTEKEFDDLLSQGYKVVDKHAELGMKLGEKGEMITTTNIGYIFLEKDDSKLTVDCSELGALFAMQYSQFADIDRNYFDKISNHTEKSNVEMYTYEHFDNRRKPCVHVEKINSKNTKKIIQFIQTFVETEIRLYSQNSLGKNLFNLFSNVILITENENKIDCEIYDKNFLDISKIKKLREGAKKIENCFAFSFFHIYSKSNKTEYPPEMFIGCILYDIKNQKTISFNLSSIYENQTSPKISTSKLFIQTCNKLFEKSHQRDNFLSIMHVSILHATYTPLPWVFFAALYPFEYENLDDEFRFLNIPEFFTFGISKEFNTEDSFYYNNITENSRGGAVIRFDLVNEKKIDYNLRFDVSKGEEFLHIDFGYYQNDSMHKLLSHFPIDMNLVKKFSIRMFVSIMSAGFYDPEFAKILKNKLKNTAEIVKQYKELSEPLKLIHNTDKKAQWLEENNLFDEYVKIFNDEKDIDKKKYYKISNKYSYLFSKDKEGEIGFSHEGLMVLVRKFKVKDSKIHFLKNYLTKHEIIKED